MPPSALPGEHHLFAEDPESAGECVEDAQNREIAEHLLTAPLSEASQEGRYVRRSIAGIHL